MIGQNLSHYRIEEELGKGGMGVVYRATDSKLGRQVAIKVLPESFARDPGRLARFEREARMVAALNHPNIAAIHGIEEDQGTRFLVLELVPGKTLEGPVPVEEALRIGRQIAEALEAAHEKDMVHRDLKPANVKITPEGKVKLLDFGLAKTVGISSSDSTLTMKVSRDGTVMGTVGYMSPEQARGAPTDKRTDIWAFGCVLYEMLAGRKAFPGRTFSDFIAAVLTGEPDWKALPEATPQHVRTLLRRCLQKDPQKRLRDIGDARFELEEPAPELMPATTVHTRWRPALLYGACLLLGAVTAAIVGWTLWHTAPASERVARFSITLPPGEVLPFDHSSQVVLSPDGARLVYVSALGAQRQLYVRRLDQLEAKAISGTTGARNPFFSPDGQWVAFWQNFKLKKVALSGGAPAPICDADWLSGGIWGADDNIVFVGSISGVSQVPASGGTPRFIARADPQNGEQFRSSDLLPGGKAVLLTIISGGIDSWDDARIAVQSLQTGERKTLIEGGRSARYSPSGHIIYYRAGVLLAAPFDLRRLAVTGPPVPVADGVFGSSIYNAAYFSLSDNGSLAYAPGTAIGATRSPVWVDRQGKEEPLPLPPRAYLHPRISPDGRQLAVEVEGPTHNFFLYDLARGALTKMSLEGNSHWPVWTPDGKRITFRSSRVGQYFTMWWVPADRSGPEERLTAVGWNQSAASWSPDGRVVAFTQVNPETSGDIWVLDVAGDRKPRPFVQTKFNEGSPRFSPDGRWIAYSSNESGRNEVFGQPYPVPGAKLLISTDGGFDPVWAQNGKELFYRNGDSMVAVDVAVRPSFTVGKPRKLWQGPYSHGLSSLCGAPGPSSSNYDVTPDGAKFLMIKEDEQGARIAQIHVVLNWSEELKRLTESKKN